MGPKLKVKTVAGDILLMDECFSEVIFFLLSEDNRSHKQNNLRF